MIKQTWKDFEKKRKANGEKIRYYKNWNIKSKFNYKNWKKNWDAVRYYENGQISIKGSFKNWKSNWLFTFYYKSGQIELNKNYKNWKYDWEYTAYYENWQLRVKQNFKNWAIKVAIKDANITSSPVLIIILSPLSFQKFPELNSLKTLILYHFV